MGTNNLSPGEHHPIHILREEHNILLEFTGKLEKVAYSLRGAKDLDSHPDGIAHLNHILEHFKDSEKHYLREENVLFPYIEKHGITGPTQVMWSEHDAIRGIKKRLYEIVDKSGKIPFKDFVKELYELAEKLSEMLSMHFQKENNILFQMALKVIKENEWNEIYRGFGEIGYCCFTPVKGEEVSKGGQHEELPVHGGRVDLGTGDLSRDEIYNIFRTLPVDITFVDREDSVRFFSETRERIFTRSKAVIGRKVQLCHPQKSLHRVEGIIQDFKAGKRDVAEFWIRLKGRLIHIRYFPVRNMEGEYLGCLEVTQDITDIQKIKGEKRLPD